MVKHWHARPALSKDKYVIILREEGIWMKIRIREKKGETWSCKVRLEYGNERGLDGGDLVWCLVAYLESQRGEDVGISRCARVEYMVAKNNIGLAPWGHRSVVVRTNRKWGIAIARIRSRKAQRFFFRISTLDLERGKERSRERDRESILVLLNRRWRKFFGTSVKLG